MSDVLLWYFAVTLLGWLSFPIAFWFFRRLPDRGYAFSRTLGLLLWGYVFWLLTSLHLTYNRSEGIVFALAIVLGFSFFSFLKVGKAEFLQWWRENRAQVGVMEALFALSLAAMAVTRAANPEALGTEKPMELAFINAILRSETFPPHDPWLSGYAISYYYFGYVLVAMLAKLCGTSGAVAFNLGTALVFALSALNAYGLLSNLLSLQFAKRLHWKPLLAPLLVLLVGNLGGLLEVLHAAGIFWQQRNGVWSSPFWKWLDLVELSEPPQLPLDGLPKRWYWWWRASRVVQDYDVSGAPREIIDEFPAFSYVLADLHPHVLAMPFALLSMALALSLWLSWKNRPNSSEAVSIVLGKRRWALRYPLVIPFAESFVAALILGGMAFLNTWDFPIYVALCAAAYALSSLIFGPSPETRSDKPTPSLPLEEGSGVRRFLEDFLRFGVWTGIWGGILYLPFYLGFSSQAGGFLPNLVYPTRGAHLWVMFAPLFVPILAWLGLHFGKLRSQLRRAIGWAGALLGALWILSLAMGLVISALPGLGGLFMSTLGAKTVNDWLPVAIQRRLLYAGSWLTLGAILSGGLAALVSLTLDPPPEGRKESISPLPLGEGAGVRASPLPSGEGKRVGAFIALLILGGALLVLFPEFFYLRDQFGWRMNTVFKFYYQAWLLWGIAAAYAVAWFSHFASPTRSPISDTFSSSSNPSLRSPSKRRSPRRSLDSSSPRSPWRSVQASLALSTLFILAGLVYTVLATLSKANNFRPPEGYTLDSTAYLWRQSPNEMQAILWLSRAPLGTVAEAVSPTGGSYTQYARVGTLSGQPIVLGWVGHESQWRGGAREIGSRQADLARLYCSRSLEEALQIVEQYRIRYIFVGDLERTTYHPGSDGCPGGLYEAKFQRAFTPVFQAGQVIIYQTP
ncbi:MAG: DUF2298 domain-containing protein [Anaerolineales bacterium]|nr:DUF2298 domain-containing protein [Anaerolineales bacterium]MDW8161372.1 DUF2298 domain-containing protein [Anaerolineales bacterium]